MAHIRDAIPGQMELLQVLLNLIPSPTFSNLLLKDASHRKVKPLIEKETQQQVKNFLSFNPATRQESHHKTGR